MAAAQDDVADGYDVTFIEPLEKDYECPICLLALREPVQTPCGHTFCKSCFNRCARQQGGDEATCPLDKQKFSVAKVFDDIKEHRKVLSLAVKCTNRERRPLDPVMTKSRLRPCDWTGELRAYQDHLGNCKYEEVQCDNDCGGKRQRWFLGNHLRFHCTRRKVNCQHCAAELEQREIEAHLTACAKLPLLCHLECGKKVKRENMTHHVSESGACPNTPLSCPFKDAGCAVKQKRHEMEEHLATSVVQHQLQQQQTMVKQQQTMVEQQQKMAKELLQLRDENKDLKRRLEANGASQNWTMLQMLELVPPQHGRMLSSCGQAILQLNIKQSQYYNSKPFLAQHTGYKATVRVLGNGGDCAIARNHLLVYILPARGDRDSELEWPFKFHHTITLIDQQQDGTNISKTVTPTELDDRLAQYCFSSPERPTETRQLELENLHVQHAMLCVPLYVILHTRSYVKNDIMIVSIQVHN